MQPVSGPMKDHGPASPRIGIEPSFLPFNSAKLLEAAFPDAPPWSMRRE